MSSSYIIDFKQIKKTRIYNKSTQSIPFRCDEVLHFFTVVLMESRITRPQKRKQNNILNQILNETLTPQNRRNMAQSTNLVNKGCLMVVLINPCRRRGGLWWRMEARAAGEENRGEGENRGKGKKKCGEGRIREGRRVFRRVRSRRWECWFYKTQKPALGVPVID